MNQKTGANFFDGNIALFYKSFKSTNKTNFLDMIFETELKFLEPLKYVDLDFRKKLTSLLNTGKTSFN